MGIELNQIHESVLQRYNKPVVHMRNQLDSRRLGLVFGAGLSRGFKIPTWESLVEALAKEPEVDGAKVLDAIPPRAGLPYRTEMLFEHFRARKQLEESEGERNTRAQDYRIGAAWRGLVRKHLYANISGEMAESMDEHPYLNQYLPLIRRTHMTVTYNFDDFLEQALLKERGDGEAETRGFESVTNPWTQFRRTDTVIYHPSGVIPQNLLEAPSDHFVFSEASFAKQLIGIFAGDQAGLVNHLSKHTCLFIGLSLEDDTLRNVLMQAASSCPGNFHYYIHYLKPDGGLDNESREAIRLANFKVYNLVTLFLQDSEIRALAELIDTDQLTSSGFSDFAEEHSIPIRFKYYVTGPLGVGKSTTINHFRNLRVLDEWLEQRPAVLGKSWESLTDDERTAADDWIVNQFKRKNDRLRNQGEGISLMDRAPIDPIAFTPESHWSEKATRLLDAICPGSAQWQVEDGQVILLQGDPKELALRMIVSQRDGYDAERLEDMERQLIRAYGADGVTKVDTRGLSPPDIARRLAEIIHLDPYSNPCQLHDRLRAIAERGASVDEQPAVQS